MFNRRPSQCCPKRWYVDGTGDGIGLSITMQQRQTLLCRGALCALFVPRLLCFQGKCVVRKPLDLAQRIVSRRHFFGSKKDEAEGLFEEGQLLYREQCFSEAAERWGRAVLLQHAPSHAHLSIVLFEGRPGVVRDHTRAFALATAGTALGCAHSKGALAACYNGGYGVATDEVRGLELGRESAAAGSCFGQIEVGWCYKEGCGGVAKDYAEAARLYRLAADQGHAVAQYNLGLMFHEGRGVAQDYAEAMRLQRLAADQGDVDAQLYMGNMLRQHPGVVNYAEATRFYRLAADQGNAIAQNNLGCMFRDGRGVARDYAEANRLYRLAADQGESSAQDNLGWMFERGQGVARDLAEAIRWYRLAAAQGHADAQESLRQHGA